jgi:hypothetical protein
MVMASTSWTEGKGCPTETGEPINFIWAPLKVTDSAGADEPCSTGMLGFVFAHPMAKAKIKNSPMICHFFVTIENPPLLIDGIVKI